MLQDAFSCRGRIGRLHFLIGSVLLTILSPIFLLAVMVVGPGLADPRLRDPFAVVALVGVVALALAGVWLGVSLHARRIRDIGWSPAPFVVGWLVFRIVDFVVPFEMAHNPMGLVVVDYGFWLVLLLMPGHGEDADAGAPPRTDANANVAARLVQAGFGRRGLS